MTIPQVIHPDGEWLLNSGAFGFYDPVAQCHFPSMVPVKARYSTWAKDQPTIKPVKDPWAPAALALAAASAPLAPAKASKQA